MCLHLTWFGTLGFFNNNSPFDFKSSKPNAEFLVNTNILNLLVFHVHNRYNQIWIVMQPHPGVLGRPFTYIQYDKVILVFTEIFQHFLHLRIIKLRLPVAASGMVLSIWEWQLMCDHFLPQHHFFSEDHFLSIRYRVSESGCKQTYSWLPWPPERWLQIAISLIFVLRSATLTSNLPFYFTLLC